MTTNQHGAIAYLYDGSLEGVLCAIFDSYARHEQVEDVYTLANAQPRIGQVFHEVKTDIGKALRVRERLISVCGYDTYAAIRAASLSEDPNKGSACLSFARFALDSNRNRWKDPSAKRLDATRAIANPETRPLLELERFVMNERHYMQQFLRFEELEGEVWFASCHPKAAVVPLLMDYFAARFNTQSFIIYDARHHIAGVYEGAWGHSHHKPLRAAKEELPSSRPSAMEIELQTGPKASAKPNGKGPSGHQGHTDWYLVQSDELTLPRRTENEEVMRAAWKRFYTTVSINERYNPELRRSFMPMRFWDDLTEMQLG